MNNKDANLNGDKNSYADLVNVKTVLKDIENEVRKHNISVDDKILLLEDELKTMRAFDGPKTVKETNLEKSLEFLYAQREYEQQKRELTQFRHEKALERIESQDLVDYFRHRLLEFFNNYKKTMSLEAIYQKALESPFILSYIEDAKKNFNLPNYQMPITEYRKALREVFKVYEGDVKKTQYEYKAKSMKVREDKQREKIQSEQIQARLRAKFIEVLDYAIKIKKPLYRGIEVLKKHDRIMDFLEETKKEFDLTDDYNFIKDYNKALADVVKMYETDIKTSKPKRQAQASRGLLSTIFSIGLANRLSEKWKRI